MPTNAKVYPVTAQLEKDAAEICAEPMSSTETHGQSVWTIEQIAGAMTMILGEYEHGTADAEDVFPHLKIKGDKAIAALAYAFRDLLQTLPTLEASDYGPKPAAAPAIPKFGDASPLVFAVADWAIAELEEGLAGDEDRDPDADDTEFKLEALGQILEGFENEVTEAVTKKLNA